VSGTKQAGRTENKIKGDITGVETSSREVNYNVIAAAIATAAATMLTLLTTLGTIDKMMTSILLKGLLGDGAPSHRTGTDPVDRLSPSPW
jgi:hypothetical protein